MKALSDVFKVCSGLCHGVATAMKTNKFLQLKSHTDLTVFRVSQVVFTRVTKFLYVLVLFCFGWLAGWLAGWLFFGGRFSFQHGFSCLSLVFIVLKCSVLVKFFFISVSFSLF